MYNYMFCRSCKSTLCSSLSIRYNPVVVTIIIIPGEYMSQSDNGHFHMILNSKPGHHHMIF